MYTVTSADFIADARAIAKAPGDYPAGVVAGLLLDLAQLVEELEAEGIFTQDDEGNWCQV